MTSDQSYELIAIYGPDHCPNCDTELVTRVSSSNGRLSLDEISERVAQETPWIVIPFSQTKVIFCPYCQ